MGKADRSTSPLSAVVAELLRLSGKSARQASRDAGLSDSYVKDIISGKSRNPTVMHLAKLARVLGSTIETLTAATYPSSERLGDRLRLFRAFLGVSQAEFAADLGLDVQRLARIEDGSELLASDAIMALKAGYDISADWLLDGSRGLLRPDFAQWLEQRSSAECPAKTGTLPGTGTAR